MTALPSQPLLSVVTTTDPVGKQLPNLLAALSALATEIFQTFEVIVVDDLNFWQGSEDVNLDGYAGLSIRPLWYPERRGQLSAMLSGLRIANGEIILTIDPDMHPCVSELPSMQLLMAQGYDIVHGARTYRPDIRWPRYLASAIVNATVRLVGGVKVSDIGSPVSLLRRTALPRLEGTWMEGNPRLNLYRLFGERVTCYPLTYGSPANTSSQYSLIMLLRVFLALLKDCLLLRFSTQPHLKP